MNGSALNVVVGIDEVRDLMTTLRRPPRVAEPAGNGMGPDERAMLLAAVSARPASTFFSFGSLVAVVLPAPGNDPEALRFEVYSRAFPLRDERLLIVEDRPRDRGLVEAGRVYLGNRRGLRAVAPPALDADAQAQLGRIISRLWAGALSTLRYRALEPASREGVKRQRAIERSRHRAAGTESDAAQALVDLADRLGPKAGEAVVSYAAAVAAPPAPRPAPLAIAPR